MSQLDKIALQLSQIKQQLQQQSDDSKLIKNLDLATEIISGMLIPVYNPSTDKTEKIAYTGGEQDLSGYQLKDKKNISNGYAGLDADAKIPLILLKVINDALETSLTSTYSIDKIKSSIATAIADIIDSSPETLNTLSELAQALGDDPNFATTVSTALGNRLRIDIDNQNLNDTQKANAIKNLGITNKLSRTILINTTYFTLSKHPANTLPTLEVNDIISNGYWNATTFWVNAIYIGGDVTLEASWNVINLIEEITVI